MAGRGTNGQYKKTGGESSACRTVFTFRGREGAGDSQQTDQTVSVL